MHTTTRAVIKADASIPADRKVGALAYLSGQAEVTLPKILISTAEAARVLSVSRQTIWRWVTDGLIRPVEIGGVRRYRVGDLQRLASGGVA